MSLEKLGTEVRRRQIAAAALEALAAGGPKALSVGAVARRVGLVPSAIYRHFRGKDEMTVAAIGLFRERIMENIRAVREESPDALERLESVLNRHVRMIRDNIAMPRVVFSDSLAGGPAGAKKLVLGNIRLYLDGLADIIKEGQAAGTIRPELAPETTAVMFLGLIMPAAILWHLTEGGFDVTRHAARAWSTFRNAIAVNTSSQKRGGR
ncbi:MAG TPA: TetR/AcrR family transcriptional regulator [Planctomycetota bacterium]|nr:TetR/AcrR family transcriptional regulator [Planctomycetota bacterium]